MYAVTDGQHYRIYYERPREALAELGVSDGTLAFDGRRSGSQYTGTAYVFSRYCGSVAYHVSGFAAPDQSTITLAGKAPYVNESCQAVETWDATLTFYRQ
jgi:hypothetical protein